MKFCLTIQLQLYIVNSFKFVKIFDNVSVWNLVTIAFERYLAVCQPFKHSKLTKSRVLKAFFVTCINGTIWTSGGSIQV